jgi:hypothetical protein
MATDRFVETGWSNGSFGALVPNSGSWSARASGHSEVLALNLTVSIRSNQTTVQLTIVGVNNVPKPARQV